MEVTNLFSKGLDIFKKNPMIAVPLIAVGILVALLNHVVIGGVVGDMGMMGPNVNMASLGALMGAAFLIGLIGMFLQLIAMGVTYVMADGSISGTGDLGGALQKALENIVDLIVASVLIGVAVFVGMMLLVLPGLAAAYLLMFAIPIVVLEKVNPLDAMKKSYTLVIANISETIVFIVIAFVLVIISGVIGAIFGFIPVLGPIILRPLITGVVMGYISLVLVILYHELIKN